MLRLQKNYIRITSPSYSITYTWFFPDIQSHVDFIYHLIDNKYKVEKMEPNNSIYIEKIFIDNVIFKKIKAGIR